MHTDLIYCVVRISNT